MAKRKIDVVKVKYEPDTFSINITTLCILVFIIKKFKSYLIIKGYNIYRLNGEKILDIVDGLHENIKV